MGEIDNKAEKRKDADIMKKYKAVFSDIDGTLLNSKHQIPENTRKKIKNYWMMRKQPTKNLLIFSTSWQYKTTTKPAQMQIFCLPK